MHFKRLGSRHIHKELKLHKAMNGMDRILCKTDQILIWRHTCKCTMSELNAPHKLSLFFSARIPRLPYVGHDNLKVELRFFPIINSFSLNMTSLATLWDMK